MTAAQRRSVTIKVGGGDHHVEVQAEVTDPAILMRLAVSAYHETKPGARLAAGFGPQIVQYTTDKQPAGSPWQRNPTASEEWGGT